MMPRAPVVPFPPAIEAPAPRLPFGSAEAVREYVAGDRIECLECGAFFAFLPRHLVAAHGLTVRVYRTAWQIPAGVALAGQAYRAKQSDKMRRLIEGGVVEPGNLAATTAAASAGARCKTPWQAAEHAAATAARPRPTLAPGARRADGRDADRAREYQRQRRATLKGCGTEPCGDGGCC